MEKFNLCMKNSRVAIVVLYKRLIIYNKVCLNILYRYAGFFCLTNGAV